MILVKLLLDLPAYNQLESQKQRLKSTETRYIRLKEAKYRTCFGNALLTCTLQIRFCH